MKKQLPKAGAPDVLRALAKDEFIHDIFMDFYNGDIDHQEAIEIILDVALYESTVQLDIEPTELNKDVQEMAFDVLDVFSYTLSYDKGKSNEDQLNAAKVVWELRAKQMK